jgi:mono/diheme cytochrome c family protein
VLKLNEKGNTISEEEIFLEKVYGRMRAICVSPAGDVYVATSNHDWNPMTKPDAFDDRILRIAKVKAAVKKPLRAKTMHESNAELVSGEMLYQKYCLSCHQAKGQGVKDIYPALAGSAIVRNEKRLIETVANGVSVGNYVMPAFNFLTKEELNMVLNYVRISFDNKLDPIKLK